MGWTIKQTAEKIGISADALRYYDKEGIISPKRNANGYRQYDDNDILFLKNIVVMKYAHFTLAEIKSMEALFKSNPTTNCNEISKNILNTKITELKQKICTYQKITALIEELLPMIDSVEIYQTNKERINLFINQIFEDIKHKSLSPETSSPILDRNEVL